MWRPLYLYAPLIVSVHTLLLFFLLQSDDLYDARDYAGSVKMSKRALRWIKASVFFYILNLAVVIIFSTIPVIIFYTLWMEIANELTNINNDYTIQN